ncbi:MAG: gliding motility-associated C-terminal domain-containing protein [Flavobacteriia bacterium]|nr:gliding motility-associated C-terminal domain-containing protein [Flavobacteriia bacterium]
MYRLLFIFYIFNVFLIKSQGQQVWFTPNKGQWHENVQYQVKIVNGEMYIEKNGFTFSFDNRSELFSHHSTDKHTKHDLASSEYKRDVIKMKYINSNLNSNALEKDSSSFYYNYFIDNDPTKWKNSVYSFKQIDYPEFYNGINYQINGTENSVKYQMELTEKNKIELIQINIEGCKKAFIDKEGKLHIQHRFGEILDEKPTAWYYDENNIKKVVKIKYVLNKKRDSNYNLSYQLEETMPENTKLIIDPNITFSSYSGSTSDNWGNTATPDKHGNLVAAGIVFGNGYPVTAGAYDVSFNHSSSDNYSFFDVSISKFNSSGSTFLFSTYLGASNGNEVPLSLICDENDNLYVLGTTSSPGFPTSGSPYQSTFAGGSNVTLDDILPFQGTDIFISKLNSSGSTLMSSTFLGGSGNDGYNMGSTFPNDGNLAQNYGDNFRGEIIIDQEGNVLIASSSNSTNFPINNGFQSSFGGLQDAVFAKLSNNLSSLLWSTYFGGNNIEAGYSLQVNSNNELYTTGGIMSSINIAGGNAPSTLGNIDGYLLKFGSNLNYQSGTYVGTSSYDQCYFVQIDDDDFVYVYGQTSGNMTVSPGLYGNDNAGQFIRKYSSNLANIIWTTKVGGNNNGNHSLSPTAFLVSDCKEIYIAGWGGDILSSSISNFPVSADAFMSTIPNGDGFYIAVLKPDASDLEYATFIGGPSSDHVDGGTSRFDKAGRVYHAVCSACGGNNSGFVSTPGVIGPSNNSGNCNMAAFKFELNAIDAVVTDPNYVICIPNPVQFFSNSINGEVFVWDFGDGTTSSVENPSHSFTIEGTYTIKLTVYDSLFCKVPDSVQFEVEVGSYEPGYISPVPTICKNTPYQLESGGGAFYTWFPSNYVNDPNISNPLITVDQNVVMNVIIGDVCGLDTFQVNINVFPDAIQVSEDESICVGTGANISVSGSVSQIWSPNVQINNPLSSNPIVTPSESMFYFVEATTQNNCVYKDSVYITVFSTIPIPELQDTARMCNGEEVELEAEGGETYLWYPNIYLNQNNTNVVSSYTPESMTYYCDFTNACGTVTDSIFVVVVIPQLNAWGDTTICYGDSCVLYAQGLNTYYWYPAKFISNNTNDTVMVVPSQTTIFIVSGYDIYSCYDRDSVFVNLFPNHQVELGPHILADLGDQIQLFAETTGIGTFNWSPNSYISCTDCQNPFVYPNFNSQYKVYFIDTNGCTTTDLIEIIYNGILYIPNTFTPDDNRFNQYFKAYGEGIVLFNMTIYNRWGEIVSEIDSIDEYWDGTYKGKLCQDGTYTWKVYYSDLKGNKNHLNGHVNLLR